MQSFNVNTLQKITVKFLKGSKIDIDCNSHVIARWPRNIHRDECSFYLLLLLAIFIGESIALSWRC